MNEICLHCHLLYFFSIILSFGHYQRTLEAAKQAQIDCLKNVLDYSYTYNWVASQTHFKEALKVLSENEADLQNEFCFLANKYLPPATQVPFMSFYLDFIQIIQVLSK